MTRPKYRNESREVGWRNPGVIRAVATALAVMLAIGLAAGCSPASVTSTTPPTSPAVTADSTLQRGPVTVYLEPT